MKGCMDKKGRGLKLLLIINIEFKFNLINELMKKTGV